MCKEVSQSKQWLLFWHWHTHTHRHMEPSSDIIEVIVRTKTVMASSPLPMLGGKGSSNRCDSIKPSKSICWKMPSFMAMFIKLYQFWVRSRSHVVNKL